MTLMTKSVRTALAGAVVATLAVGVTAAPAEAGHGRDNPCKKVNCKFNTKSKLKPTPPDPYGKNARASITGFRGKGNYTVHFQAYDELIYLKDNHPDSHKAVVRIKYNGPGGPYRYTYRTGSSRRIELGKDGDLTESKRIKMRLCIAHHRCTGWAKAFT